MTPTELTAYLTTLTAKRLPLSVMIWGAPGIGKSSIVAQVAAAHGLPCIDLRLSQLAPTDLRGLPVADGEVARWLPPEFLPRTGSGILFMDEINLAPPALQGVAQQLVLDRRVGSYALPEGWLVWAAGNRKEDRAAVFDMPAPLANRFLHLNVEVDFESFKSYGFTSGVPEQVLAFLSYRPELLHRFSPAEPAWPSPRTWVLAGQLLAAGLAVAPAVGEGAAAEFDAYRALYADLPDLDLIRLGKGDKLAFPAEPSARYATVVGLALRLQNGREGGHAFRWLVERAEAEWVQVFAGDALRHLRSRKQLGELAKLLQEDERLQRFFTEYQELLAS